MFFDLNVPVPSTNPAVSQQNSKKGKGKQQTAISVSYNASQITAFEARVDLLVHLGYSVIAFSQTVQKRVDSKTHVNVLDGLLHALRTRPGIIFLKRLNIILDEDSEKGFGMINANISLFNSYDLLALIPTTQATFSLSCLTHTQPSPLTTHIISLPLTLPRLPFYLKHTLIRTAIKNGAVFEINYVGALGGENESVLVDANACENGPVAKRNWWASARELVRVTKGKGLIVSGGVVSEADLRPPRDVANLITILGLAQDAGHNAVSKTPKALVLRAQTRKTYRAVLSEPKVVIPEASSHHQEGPLESLANDTSLTSLDSGLLVTGEALNIALPQLVSVGDENTSTSSGLKKRPLDESTVSSDAHRVTDSDSRKKDGSTTKKRKKNRDKSLAGK